MNLRRVEKHTIVGRFKKNIHPECNMKTGYDVTKNFQNRNFQKILKKLLSSKIHFYQL